MGPAGWRNWAGRRHATASCCWNGRIGWDRCALSDALTVALQIDWHRQPQSGAVGLAGPDRPHRMSRERLIAAFLERNGYGAARAEPLAQDASFRRYLRLIGGPRPAVLMDAPPPEDIRPFVQIAGHLAQVGISVPEIVASDEAAGPVAGRGSWRRSVPEVHRGCG